ncbi:NUDIX domain-containing protein [Actinoalloteichus sp. AHMU CJ021]|uniref:ADP-ribose pyrophosphatase YjhB, NUDIX family n=1 Tax=Actinoalloteichus caeruleus DSM 43889 TaxID=1120930 RepID=A0ABT1JDY5_ACTCY|nr:NUDIX domain-containing protein [Actinoalloteichus caeruleus]AUS81323.1 NUDIX domain-containing protein [Actinoalloteichus sp. AHMU CJ021]MCP2330702.1 ADP-ribose pyrophosphatase YjhB, NUDIX family [Actinoalloteichus caeruleus DSM 43889]
MPERHLVDVHVILVRDDELLLSLRRDTDPRFDGQWHLPAGKLEAGESVLAGAAREAREEVGVSVRQDQLRLVHTAHVTAPGVEPRLGLFFEATRWSGVPFNREPEKSSGVAWFRFDALPSPLIAYSAVGIAHYRAGVALSVLGWDDTEVTRSRH